MKPAFLRVLVIAPADRCNAIRDAFQQRGRCRLSAVTSYRDLFNIPRQESFELAILHEMLSIRDLRDSSAHIRRTWPGAKIVVICAQAEVLDDPLYDERIAPSDPPDALLATIERLMVSGRKRRRALSNQQLALQSSLR
jgi:DNA-binding NtrC family response regulator